MMQLHRPMALVLPVFLVLSTGCSKEPTTKEAEKALIPAGKLMEDSINFQYAIYYLPTLSGDPRIELNQILANTEKAPTLVEELPTAPGDQVISIKTWSEEEVLSEYKPPDLESIQYFARGLSREQAEALQTSRQVFIVNFAHDKAHVWQGLRTANQIVLELAQKTGGLLWDEETRQVFTPEAWDKARVQTWKESVPDITDHTTIHAYKNGDFVRAITLGMAKVGLPDVVVENFPWSDNSPMGNLINIFSQTMAEGLILEKPGEYNLDIRKIQHQEVREKQLSGLKANATAQAQISLKMGEWEEGDPQNRLIEITFDDASPAKDIHAKQEAALSSMFGWEDSISYIKHTDALIEARDRAKTKLPKLREDFEAGLQPGEFIQVKGPFATPDGGQEWMWVEITAWQGSKITGILKNEPFHIPSLHAGQIVEVKEKEVFDYIRKRPDGTLEGNETGEIISQMEAAKGN